MFLVETKPKTTASADLKGLIFSSFFSVTKKMGSEELAQLSNLKKEKEKE